MWERYNRVHLNTVENLVVLLPLLWTCSTFLHPHAAAALGLVFVIARAIYSRAYTTDPATRGRGAWLSGISLYLLVLCSLIGLALHAFSLQ